MPYVALGTIPPSPGVPSLATPALVWTLLPSPSSFAALEEEERGVEEAGAPGGGALDEAAGQAGRADGHWPRGPLTPEKKRLNAIPEEREAIWQDGKKEEEEEEDEGGVGSLASSHLMMGAIWQVLVGCLGFC